MGQPQKEALLNLEEVRREARRKMNPVCSVCPVCNGIVCAGQVPGMGGVGTGSSFKNNVTALAAYRLNMRTLHDVSEPQLGIHLWGHALTLPVLGAAMAGAKMNMGGSLTEHELLRESVLGVKAVGTFTMTGDGPVPEILDAGLSAIREAEGHGITIIKPRPLPDIIARAKLAKEAGAVAIGIDVDAAALIPMTRAGQPVGPKPLAELREIVAGVELPLLLKGIMTADEAETAIQAGVAGIVVSNHGGRSLDHLPGTAEVLPEIAAVAKGKLTVLVDGGVRSGVDVLKMLALGADAVLIGRPFAMAAIGGGAEGVATYFRQIESELRTAMMLTGCPSPAAAGPRLLRKAGH
jgi:4-hydroxymandelate oxidase